MNQRNAQLSDNRLLTAVLTLILFGLLTASSFAQFGTPPTITAQPLDQTVKKGGSVTFTVSATSGTQILGYQWFKDGNPIVLAIGSSYTINNVDFADAGVYRVNITNLAGTTTSSNAVLTVVSNSPPVASDDSYTVTEDMLLTVAASGVLTNDSDSTGDAISALLVSNASNGSLTLYANGSFSYRPSTNFNGTDSFAYSATDNESTGNVATITITVTAVNDRPIAVNDSVTTPEDTSVTIDVLSNDSDAEGSLLTLTGVSTTNGIATVNGTNVIYTPSTNFYGTAVLSYFISDGALSATGRVTVTVSPVYDPIVAINDSTNTMEDTSVTIRVLGNDQNVERLPVTITGTSTTNGTAVISGTNIVFTPATNYNGTLVFSYTTSDGVSSPTANVTVTVGAVNDTPVGVNDFYTTPEDVLLTVVASGVLLNDFDADADPLAAVLVSNPANGNLSLSTNGGFIYTPNTNYNGSDSFTYRALPAASAAPVVLEQLVVGDKNMEIKLGQKGAQRFRHGTAGQPSYMISKVVLYLSREAPAPNTPLLFNIGTGINSNAVARSSVVIDTVSISNATSGSSFQPYEISYQAPIGPFTAGASYYLNLQCEASNGRRIWTDYNDVNGYANGTYYKGGSDDTKDMLFQISGSDTSSIPVATVTIDIIPVNDPPFAINDSTNTLEDVPVTISVLRNDSDVEGPISITGVSTTNGTALVSGTNIVFTPSSNYFGTVVFSYTISDGTNSATANVTVTVTAVNDPPVTYNDTYSTVEDVVLSIPSAGILTNDLDVDSGTLTAVLVTSTTQGTLGLNANGSFTYTPNLNFNGTDSFTYRARDGLVNGNLTSVTINVTPVNDAPLAVNDSTNTLEDTSVTINVLRNDSDVEGPIIITGVSTTNGTALVSGTNVVFTPPTNYFGTVVLSYTISDGTNSATANVTVTVAAVNDAPVTYDDSYSTAEDVVLTIPAAGILTNDVDVDSGTLTAVLVASTSQGILGLNANGSFTYTPNLNFNGTDSFTYRARDGLVNGNLASVTINVTPVNDVPLAVNDSTNTFEDTSITISVLRNDSDVEGPITITGVSTTNGTALASGTNVVFTPASNYFGTVVFSYTISDGTNAATANVTVSVTSVNDAPPVATNDTYLTAEDVRLTIVAPGILSNDWDVDGDGKTALLVSSVSQGTLSLNADGSFIYTPATNYYGSDSFTYRATDGIATGNVATVTINVTPVNDTPFANNDSTNTLEDTSVTINVLGNDSDVEGPMTITGVSTTNGTALVSGTNIVFAPATNYFGTAVFSYTISDGTNSATANVTVTVTAVNDPPVTYNNTYSTAEDVVLTIPSAGILTNDVDVDSGTLTAVLVTSTSQGTLNLNANGSFTYTPNLNFNGTDSFTYRARDGLVNGNLATVTINVTPVNDIPVANNDSTNTLEDTSVTISVLRNDSDVEGPMTITGVSTTNGTALVSGTNIVFAPATNFNGTAVFSYTISDGTNSATAMVTVNVISVNDAPPIATNNIYSTMEDVVLNVSAPGILANDWDVDNDPFTALLVSNVGNGTLTFNTNGSFTYRPNTNFYGTDSFTYRTTDGMATGNVATVTISVTSVNDVPLPLNDVTNTLEDTSVTISVLVNDSDVEDTLSIVSAATTNGTVVISGTNIVFTPATNFNGTVVFSYIVFDDTDSAIANVSVTVMAVNDVPFAVDDVASTPEDTGLTINVLANDSDVERSPLSVIAVSTTNGTATISGTNIVYTPPANYFGTVFLTYTMSDGTLSATAKVTVTVISVNDTPIGGDDAYVASENVPLTIPAPGVLENDTDVENGPLSALLVTDVAHGTLSLSASGSFTYLPDSNYFGADSFTYQVSDGSALSAITTVSLNTTVTTPLRFVFMDKTNDGFRLRLAGPSPAVYTVLASTNNTDWTPISTNVAFTGSVTVLDSAATNNANRFYAASMGGQATTIVEGNSQGGSSAQLRQGKRGAQSFRHGSSGDPAYTLSKVVFWISRSSTLPSFNVTCYIGTGINSGAVAGSSITINPITITNTSGGSSFQRYEVLYPKPVGPLNAGTTYYLNIECDTDNQSRLYVEQAGVGTAYSKGTYYSGGSDQFDDARFEIWGQ